MLIMNRSFLAVAILLAVIFVSGCISTANIANDDAKAAQIIAERSDESFADAEITGIIRPVILCSGIPDWIREELCDSIEYTLTSQDRRITYVDPFDEYDDYTEYGVYSAKGTLKKITAPVCDCVESGIGDASAVKQRDACENDGGECAPGSVSAQAFEYVKAAEPMEPASQR